MKVAKLFAPDDIRILDIPVPKPSSHEALIKTKCSGICSGDVMPWYIANKAPLVLGHEVSGEIAEVGKDVKDFKVGDRVFVHHHAPCLNCLYCLRGDYVHCKTWRQSKIIPGGISEYVLIPQVNLEHDTLILPDSVSFEDGALVEPTACVVKSLKRSRAKKGDTLLVIGLGVMGLMHILLAREFGFDKVIGIDFVQYRRQKAVEFGANAVIAPEDCDVKRAIYELTNGKMAEIVVVCPNSLQAMKEAFDYVSAGGCIVFFTPAKPDEVLSFCPNDIYFKDITITTSYSCGPDDTKRALGFIAKGIISASKLVSHRFRIEDTPQAYKLTAQATNSLKCMIVFED